MSVVATSVYLSPVTLSFAYTSFAHASFAYAPGKLMLQCGRVWDPMRLKVYQLLHQGKTRLTFPYLRTDQLPETSRDFDTKQI